MAEPIATVPIGHDERGNPIEEVVTTARRVPSIPWDALLAGAALGLLVYQLLDQRPARRRSAAVRSITKRVR